MSRIHDRRRFVSAVIAFAFAVSMLLSGTAIVSYVPDVATGAIVSGDSQIDAAPSSTNICLRNARFDTAYGDPEMPVTLGISNYPDHVKGAYIVQKQGPITEEWKRDIMQAGGEILAYIPDNAYLVRMDNSVKDKVGAVKGNQWMGIYQPAYKIAPELQGKQGKVIADIDLFVGGNNGPAVRYIRDNGGSFLSVINDKQTNKIRAEFDSSLTGELASMPDVNWIAEFQQPKNGNAATTIISQSGSGGSTRPIHAKDIRGQNMIAAISDSGVAAEAGTWDSVDHPNFNGMVYGASGTGPKILHYYVPTGADGQLGDESEASYHGSHCAGTVLGDGGTYGTYDTATYDGHAYMAQLVFQDIGREDDPNTTTTIESDYVYPPSDYYNVLYGEPYAEGARVHSNSWGGGYGYSSEAAISDKFIWDKQDYVICFAAGNDGAASTIGSQAESKNMITVGATSSGTSMASFSSQGPADDGRIKPDVSNCGVGIYSVNGGGGYQTMDGTSMATPATAGASVLVRQYYVEGWYPTGTKISANGFSPSTALVKATLINGGVDIRGSRPDMYQGWGQVHLDNSLFFSGDTIKMFAYDNKQGMVTGDYMDFTFGVAATSQLSVSLVYSDYPGSPTAAKALVNDLGLLVTGPTGTMWRGNNFAAGYSVPTTTSNNYDVLNNVEGVRLSAPATGTYVVRVSAQAVAYGPQNFALVVTGGLTDGYGKVFMDRTEYDDADTITVNVEDSNNAAPTVSVTLTSLLAADSETISIPWTATQSGKYNGGTILTQIGTTTVGDGKLQVLDGDTITASYADGSPAFTATAKAWVDFHGPVISNVFVTDITGTSAAPTWTTDENANSKVYYRVYGQSTWSTTTDALLMVSHKVALKGLTGDTKYEFYVESTDWRGRTTTDDKGGAYYTFRTTSSTAGGALILLVDDDIGSVSDLDGAAFELDWKNNLAYYGWTYTHWDLNVLGDPTTADLNQAPMIIWTVSEGYPQLGAANRAALKGYLDQATTSSGTVPMAYIVGQDIGWDMSSAGTDPDVTWLANYLAATFNRDDADGGAGNEGGGKSPNKGIDPMQVGDIGHVLNDVYNYDAMNLEQDVYGADRFWPDSVTVTNNIGANIGVASWDYETSKVTGDSAGIAQTNGGLAETARIQYEAFAHDMLTSTGTTPNWNPAGTPPTIDSLRAGVLDETIRWLLGGNHPTISLTAPVGGSTITSTTTTPITWTVSGAASIDVYYSPNSGQEYIKLTATPLSGTATSYTWNVAALQDGNTYRVKVVALGTATYATLSAYSQTTDFTISHSVDTVAPVTKAGTVDVSKNPINKGDTITLTATIDDSTTGRSNIQAAQWCIGATPVWPGTAMTAADGSFNSLTEGVTVSIPGATTNTWSSGTWQKLWVRGQDAKGNWATLGTYVEIYVNGVSTPPYAVSLTGKAANSWVFISFPSGVTGTIETVLNDAAMGDSGTTWSIAKWYNPATPADPWKTYRVGGTANDMPTVNNQMGFWVYITANGGDQALTLSSYAANPASTVISLAQGWNLVGYPSSTDRSGTTTPSQVTVISVYSASAAYTDRTDKSLVTLHHGNAYFMYATAATTWTVTQP